MSSRRTGVLIGDRKGVLIGDRTGNFGVAPICDPFWSNSGCGGVSPIGYGGAWYPLGGGGGNTVIVSTNDNSTIIPTNSNHMLTNTKANDVNCACLTGTPHIVDGNCTCEDNNSQIQTMTGIQPNILDWIKANPLPSLAIVGGILWFLTRK